jgi:hypothetical protein
MRNSSDTQDLKFGARAAASASFKIKTRLKALMSLNLRASQHLNSAKDLHWVPHHRDISATLARAAPRVMVAIGIAFATIALLPKRDQRAEPAFPIVSSTTETAAIAPPAALTAAPTLATASIMTPSVTPIVAPSGAETSARANSVILVPIQAPAQPTSPPTVSGRLDAVPRAAVQKFVTDFYLSNEDQSAEQIDAIYAAKLQYFGAMTSRAAIVREKLAYYRRWPQRQFTLDPDTLKISTAPETPRLVDISFEYDFTVRSADRASSGRGSARITLDLTTPEGQIVREEGRVTSRQR